LFDHERVGDPVRPGSRKQSAKAFLLTSGGIAYWQHGSGGSIAVAVVIIYIVGAVGVGIVVRVRRKELGGC